MEEREFDRKFQDALKKELEQLKKLTFEDYLERAEKAYRGSFHVRGRTVR